MTRVLIVEGQKTFRITIPDEAKVTFGPWSPGGDKDKYPNDRGDTSRNGTLRVYTDKNVSSSIIGVWSGVKSFRDTSIEYEEKTDIQTGSTLWHSDKTGYKREESVQREEVWGDEKPKKLLPSSVPPVEDNF